MTWWWLRLEAEGEEQRAALDRGEAAKAHLDLKLRRKEEEVDEQPILSSSLTYLLILFLFASPQFFARLSTLSQVSIMAKQLSKAEQEIASMKKKKK